MSETSDSGEVGGTYSRRRRRSATEAEKFLELERAKSLARGPALLRGALLRFNETPGARRANR